MENAPWKSTEEAPFGSLLRYSASARKVEATITISRMYSSKMLMDMWNPPGPSNDRRCRRCP